MSDLSTSTTELSSNSKSSTSTFAADDVGKDQNGVPKSIIELGGSLTTMIANQGHSTPTTCESPPTVNAAPDVDLQEPEVPILRDDEETELWIPKGNPDRPDGTQTQPTKPARPPKN